jgi:hypothetical protein
VDGQEYAMRWGQELTLPLPAGDHVVETFIRYKGTGWNLGTGQLALTATPDDDLHVHARNGSSNGTPFKPVLVSATPS